MVQTINDSESLRLDGIYLHEDSLGIVDLYYLYPNGTILSRGSVTKDGLEAKLAKLEASEDEKYKAMKYLWGRYIISGETITFQKWGTSDKPYRAYNREGLILNDSTFVIYQMTNSNGKELINMNETYRFRKTTSKPDPSNKWLEKDD